MPLYNHAAIDIFYRNDWTRGRMRHQGLFSTQNNIEYVYVLIIHGKNDDDMLGESCPHNLWNNSL